MDRRIAYDQPSPGDRWIDGQPTTDHHLVIDGSTDNQPQTTTWSSMDRWITLVGVDPHRFKCTDVGGYRAGAGSQVRRCVEVMFRLTARREDVHRGLDINCPVISSGPRPAVNQM
jgi:hypothetical protein